MTTSGSYICVEVQVDLDCLYGLENCPTCDSYNMNLLYETVLDKTRCTITEEKISEEMFCIFHVANIQDNKN